jgi:hypothetical protein
MEAEIKAAAAVRKIFEWCLMPDVGESNKTFLAGAVAIIAEYPPEVMEKLADPQTGTRVLKDRPSLAAIRKACDELFAPIIRQRARQAASESSAALLLDRPKPTIEQRARVAALATEVRRKLGGTTGPPDTSTEHDQHAQHAQAKTGGGEYADGNGNDGEPEASRRGFE